MYLLLLNGGTSYSNIIKGSIIIGNNSNSILVSSNLIWDNDDNKLIISGKKHEENWKKNFNKLEKNKKEELLRLKSGNLPKN